MDARPNVLNKILPCQRKRILQLKDYNSSKVNVGVVYCFGFSPDADKYIQLFDKIPPDIKSGSDVIITAKWFPWATNDQGADQVVRLIFEYNYARTGEVLGSAVVPDPVLITIPDGMLLRDVRKQVLFTVSGLQADDYFGMIMYRDADHTDDTFVYNWTLLTNVVLEYTADKIGVT